MFERLRAIWRRSGDRYLECESKRKHRQDVRDSRGDWREIESSDRLRTRLYRKGMAEGMADSLVTQAESDLSIGNSLLERIIATQDIFLRDRVDVKNGAT